MTKFVFTLEHDGTLPAGTAIRQAIGAASMCWDERPTGVFDDVAALEIADALEEQLSAPASLPELTELDDAALQRFTSPNFALPDGRREAVEELRRTFYDAALALILAAPPTKSRAVALTELETAMMWAVKAFYGAPGEKSYQPVPS